MTGQPTGSSDQMNNESPTQVGYLPRKTAGDLADSIDGMGGRVDFGIRLREMRPDRYWSFTLVTNHEPFE